MKESPVKIKVNFDLCASNAVCMSLAPDVFEVRDDGYLYILNETPGPERADAVRDAVNGCPTGAISLED
jgi:ferredoxin